KRILKFHCGKCRCYELTEVLQNTITDKERIIEQQQEIIDLLKEKMKSYEDRAAITSQQTYATVLGGKTNIKVDKNNNYPDLIFKPKKAQSVTQTRSDIEREIKPSELKVGIKKIKTLRDGALAISCQTRAENETFKAAAEKSLGKFYEIEGMK
ncbi:hypothetical protein HHI36_022574, partial [Cryptolaemus montrouzieri]